MSKFLVDVNMVLGGYEKTTRTHVEADNVKDARTMALAIECHGNARWEDDDKDSVYDLGGEFAYRAGSVEVLAETESATLSKLGFHCFTYDADEISSLVDG